MLHGARGKSSAVRNWRTLSGALCSENHDVPGSSSSSTDSASESESAFVVSSWGLFAACFVEMWVRVRA